VSYFERAALAIVASGRPRTKPSLADGSSPRARGKAVSTEAHARHSLGIDGGSASVVDLVT
jgi:hypothetical protein